MEWAEHRGAAGSVLRLARNEAGLTQDQLGELAGVPQSTISAYERGTRQPTMPVLERFLKAAGFHMRIHLTPTGDHDDAPAGWKTPLTPDELANAEAGLQSALAAQARPRQRLNREGDL